jgi:hypothetical protein
MRTCLPPPTHTPLLNGFVSERVAVEELMAQEAGAVGSGASGLGVWRPPLPQS